MCEWLINQEKDIEISSIQELMDAGISELVLHKGYSKLPHTLDARFCLCELDIEATIRLNGYEFLKDHAFGYWVFETDSLYPYYDEFEEEMNEEYELNLYANDYHLQENWHKINNLRLSCKQRERKYVRKLALF